MADFIHTTSKQVELSKGDATYYYDPNWIKISHDLALTLKSVRTEFRMIENGVPRIMTQQEQTDYLIAHPGPTAPTSTKSKTAILNEIWASFDPPTGSTPEEIQEKIERKMRLLAAINANAVWLEFLNDASWATAREYMQNVLAVGQITSGDYNIIDGIIPT